MQLDQIIDANRIRIKFQAKLIETTVFGGTREHEAALAEWFAKNFWNQLDDEITFGDLREALKMFLE